MGIKHPDLFVPVLAALLIHGMIALVPVPERSIQLRTFQINRPLAVRFVTTKNESVEKVPPAEDLKQPRTIEKESSERKKDFETQTDTPLIRKTPVKKSIKPASAVLRNEKLKNNAISEKRIEMSTNTDIKMQSISGDAESNIVKKNVKIPSLSESYTDNKKESVPRQVEPGYRDNPPPAYPQIARRRGYEGVVVLFVEVRSDGTVENVTIKESSGKTILDRAALEGVRTWTFYPALREGKPVSARIEVPVRFVLK
ncbi:MAG: energy transducer TonB [Syntrophales bacterium]|jgi:protein TonB|nr:energy transducer TonB [Syntrophales bacterium]MDY0045416.1 energy transducer TonB [Syntrophales bacterium]